MFASRYFVSNCAKRVNVTRSGLALPLAAGLICIHTWKTGLQQGSPAPSFLSLFPSCILARKSALVKKKKTKNQPHTMQTWGRSFLTMHMFYFTGCFFSERLFWEAGRFRPRPHRAPALPATLGEGSLAPGGGTCSPRALGFATHVGNILRWPWFMQKR